MFITDFFPLIQDVKETYRRLREEGRSREEGVVKVKATYAAELTDADDGPQVWIGLADVTGRRKELTWELLDQAEAAFAALENAFPKARTALRARRKVVCDPGRIGSEAKYRKKSVFKLDWQIGDTFLYPVSGKDMVEAGLDGWYIVCRYARELVLAENCVLQGMYYSLCPPDKIPKTVPELERLGYVPLLELQPDRYLFMGRLWVLSRSDEKRIGFTKLGNFAGVSPPADEVEIDSVCHSFSEQYPVYVEDGTFWHLERAVFRGYTKHGIQPAQRQSI